MNERNRLIANLYALAKKKGIRIKDLETSCGVSVGYLARLRQDEKQPMPGFDFLYRAAALLEVSVDALLYFDYSLASDTDQYLHAFIDRLNLDTLMDKLSWAPDPACIPDSVVREGISFPEHPLLGLDAGLIQEGKSKEIYSSPFRPAVYNLRPSSAWRASLSGNVVVFLTRVVSEPEADSPAFSGEETELYLYHQKEKALSPLCWASPERPGPLDHALALLCETVDDSLHRTDLDRLAVSSIDAYMNS